MNNKSKRTSSENILQLHRAAEGHVPTSQGLKKLERGMANHFSILALRRMMNPWSVRKAERYDTERRAPPVSSCPTCYWGRVDNRLQKKWRELAKAERTPSCGCVGGESKVWRCKEQYCIGTWNIGSMNQGELKVDKQRWQEWISTFKNQWTKMDGNGLI